MKARALVLVVVAIVTTACRPDTLELRYRYDFETQKLQYVLNARAQAEWRIGEPGRGSYRVRFRVDENITPQEDGGAIVDVTMTPLDVQENGLLPPGSEQRSFRLALGPNGEKLDVLEVGGIPATQLDDDELALIGTYRPPLPLEPVGLGDTWRARQEVTLQSVFQQLATAGVLESLHRNAAGHRVAMLSYEGAGPLTHVLALPHGEATLSGETSVNIDADLDIDRGVLLRAKSTTAGVFDARVIPEGEEAPITGTLELKLELDIRET